MAGAVDIPGPLVVFVIYALPTIINEYAIIQKKQDLVVSEPDILLNNNQKFDFIIVGAGSAGAVVAHRLSAAPNNYSVLVLEAGGDPNWVTYVPAADILSGGNPEIDWMYFSEPMKYCSKAMIDNKISCWRGKSLGGSSVLNFMIYIRGNQQCFDQWATMTEDPSWNSTNLLKYFKKMENYNGNYPNSSVHGSGGPQNVDKSNYHPGLQYFLDALPEWGMIEQDVNVNQTNGFMRMDSTTNNGIRWSTYSAYIQPSLKRKNLKVFRYSQVNKILFDESNPPKVVGVEYVRHSIKKRAYVNKELIVSAGAINSPKLLLLSGIGPKDDLAALNIPLVKDLPVGQNMYDHPTTVLPILFNTTDSSFMPERVDAQTVQDYNITSGGPLSTNNAHSTHYFSSPINNDATWPDIQVITIYLGMSNYSGPIIGDFLNMRQDTFKSYLEPYVGMDGQMLIMVQVKPRSVGTVKLAGTDPNNKPLIDLNYFSDDQDDDFNSFAWGVKQMGEMIENSTSFARVDGRRLPTPFPGCEDPQTYPLNSDAYWKCYLRQFTFSLWHYSGTCKMGKPSDPTAVVDPTLKVLGIQNLRVIDASIMPKVTNGNTNAPSIMIGEKGADMILSAWNGSDTVTGATNQINTIITGAVNTANNLINSTIPVIG